MKQLRSESEQIESETEQLRIENVRLEAIESRLARRAGALVWLEPSHLHRRSIALVVAELAQLADEPAGMWLRRVSFQAPPSTPDVV